MKRIHLLLVIFFLLTAPLHGQFGGLTKILDKVKEFSSLEITEEDEIALGRAVSERIRADFGVVQDEEATRYVTLVGLLLAQESKRSDLPWEFFILDSDGINAFAAPGGLVHITRGALASMQDEAELATVLGHEITHITEKHTIKGVQKMKGIELAEGQTDLRGNSEVLDQVADGVYEAFLQGFSRKEEMESDEDGLKLAAEFGYDPDGLVRFLELLKLLYRDESERAGLFASHPETQDRIKEAQKQISREKWKQKSSITLGERFDQFIQYDLVPELIEEFSSDGARGLASGEEKEDEEGEKKTSRFSLSALKNPLDTREEKPTAEVSGAGGARGVDPRNPEAASGPKNPNPVAVTVTDDDLKKFKQEGQLR